MLYQSAFRNSVSSTGKVFRISAAMVIPVVFSAIALSVCASLIATYLKLHGGGIPFQLWRMLYVGVENNWPTWLSSFNLLACSALLFVIARSDISKESRHVSYFTGLGLLFLALSIDEAASLHEVTITPVQRLLGTTGALYSAWVIPGMVLVLLFAMAYLRFYLSLPSRYQVLFGLAGAVYVGGAIGGEMLSWHYRFPTYDPADPGSLDFGYALLEHVEEAFEMVGVGVFLSALLLYMSDQRISFSVAVSR